MPEPRLSGSISVSFTPRAFRTAARESKAPEEEEVCLTFSAIYTALMSPFLVKGMRSYFFRVNLIIGVKS